jgi:hypothetical protein
LILTGNGTDMLYRTAIEIRRAYCQNRLKPEAALSSESLHEQNCAPLEGSEAYFGVVFQEDVSDDWQEIALLTDKGDH